jgi:RimJ/RimL family protein N-acetyltransferase
MQAALSILNQSTGDPALLRGTWSLLARAAKSASRTECVELAAWLQGVMTDNPWFAEDAQLLRAAGHIALACMRVDLAHSTLSALDEMGQMSAGDLAALACCHEQLGSLDAALATCDRALASEQGHQDALAARERVARRKDAMSAPWRLQQQSSDSPPILVEPLVPDHAPMLARQMRDPSIASMTALPPLVEGEDGRAWIQRLLDEGTHAYAIIHCSLGFVGYMDLRVWESTAFICYWIGPDYQGQGLCAPVIRLGCDLAFRNGIELVLTACYEDNVRSLRALYKTGFVLMADVRAMAPDNERVFVMRPAKPMDADLARQKLIEFCDNTNSGLRFEPVDATSKGDSRENH